MAAPKLTKEQALKIREVYANPDCGGAGMLALAQRYGVSVTLIHQILSGKHSLTQGLPNIGGTRRVLKQNGSSADDRFAGRAQGAKINKRAAAIRGPVSVREKQLRTACPLCGAKPREKCHRPGAAFYSPIESFHTARKAAAR